MDHDTVAFDFFNGKELPSSMEAVIAKAWINSNKIKENATVQEQAIALRYYNIVLSLIWVKEDIDI